MYIIYIYIKSYIYLSKKFKFLRNKTVLIFFFHFSVSLHVTEFINRQGMSSKTEES